MSNGAGIYRLDEALLERLSSIQVTLYGYDNESYYNFTGAKNAADAVRKSFAKINLLQFPAISTTCIVTPDNVENIERYIEFAIEIGVKHLTFGMSVPSGKASRNKSVNAGNRRKYIEERIQFCANKYADDIFIDGATKSVASQKYSDYKFHCQAGKTIIVVSENGYIRPCIMLPEHRDHCITVNEYIDNYIEGGTELDEEKLVRSYHQGMQKEGYGIFDMECAGFCKISEVI